MPFKKYKASHGGAGPLESAYATVTGGVGYFGQLGMKRERAMTEQLISDIEGAGDEFAGLSGLLQQGRSSALTREQHAEFRANVTQAALNTRVINAGYADFTERMKSAREQAVSKEDGLMLDNMEMMARHAQRLSAVGNIEKGSAMLGTVLSDFGAYVSRNEEQRLELESSEAAGRETLRKEFQGRLDGITAPMQEDAANYAAIRSQLEGPDGSEVAAPSLVSTVLEYAGAQLRQSDDGNWSVSLGPVGFSDTNLPAMTYSQIRNRLEQAYQGRAKALGSQLQGIGADASKRGMGVNGTRVDDLYFPLANEAYRQREQESKPPNAMTPEGAASTSQKVTDAIANTGRGFLPNIVNAVSNAATALFDPNNPTAEDFEPQKRLPVNGDPPPRRAPVERDGTVRGVYVPPALRGLFQ